MEAALMVLNGIAVVVMIYMGLRDDRLPPGAPHSSIFRMLDIAHSRRAEREAEKARRLAKSRL